MPLDGLNGKEFVIVYYNNRKSLSYRVVVRIKLIS